MANPTMNRTIVFSVQDDRNDPTRTLAQSASGEALVFGARSEHPVVGLGVLPAHVVALEHEGEWLFASSSATTPAYTSEGAIPTDWTPLTIPCAIVVGSAQIDFFYGQPSAPSAERTKPDDRPRTTAAAPGPRHTGEQLVVAAAHRLRDDWRKLSRPKRLMVPLLVALAIIVFQRPSLGRGDVGPSTTRELDPTAIAAAGLGNPSPATSASAALLALPAPAAPSAGQQVLPSSRSLPTRRAAVLTRAERQLYDKAIDAMFNGEYAAASTIIERLGAAHPDAAELHAARKVLAVKIRASR